jgi:hypothetical protein
MGKPLFLLFRFLPFPRRQSSLPLPGVGVTGAMLDNLKDQC